MDIHLLIPRYPAIYPAGFLIQFWLVRLAAACSCCIAFTQATVFYICDSRSGLIQARRPRRWTGWGPAVGPPGWMWPSGRATGPVGARRQGR